MHQPAKKMRAGATADGVAEDHLGTTAQRRHRLYGIRHQIRELEGRLLQLKEQEVHQPCGLEELAASSTPINNLSDDILREIFLLALPTAQELAFSTHSIPFDMSEAPLLLCLVSKWWKEVAENYAALWTTLRVCMPFDEDGPGYKNVPYGERRRIAQLDKSRRIPGIVAANIDSLKRWTTGWLRLTKNSCLQLHLINHTPETNSISSALHPTVCGRLRKLSLAGDYLTYGALGRLSSATSESVVFPVLEELVIGKWKLERGWREVGPIGVFEMCPRLQRVIVGRMWHKDHFPTILLPWKQLTHFVVLTFTPIQFYADHMMDCPLLRFTVISPDRVDSDDWKHGEADKMVWNWPNLSSLTLDFWDGRQRALHRVDDDTNELESAIFTPAHLQHIQLETLESLRLIGRDMEMKADELTRLESSLKSMTALQHLSLCGFGPESQTMFRQLPQLTTLDIQYYY